MLMAACGCSAFSWHFAVDVVLGNLGAFRSAIPHVEALRHWLGLQQYRKEMQDLVAVWSSITHGGNSAPGTFVGMGVLAFVQAWRNLSRHRTLAQQ